jgi:hypothetical protein
MIMPLENISDWELRLARQDAFWDCAIIDRPLVLITLPRPTEDCVAGPPPKHHDSIREAWFDSQHRAEWALAGVSNTLYLGDALPSAWPNLGPDVFSAYLGSELEYANDTAWSRPMHKDWAELEQLRCQENLYWQKTLELTAAYLEAGRGKFYVALTDLHAGADALASLREPQQLCLDLLEEPKQVKRLLHIVTDEYLRVFDLLRQQLADADQLCGCNAFGIFSRRNWNMGCNDFSYMISKQLFDEVFLPEIIRECRHVDATCYHLDGIGALHHLDSLLEVPEITAIQWVPGTGHGGLADWLDVYRRCQAAGKGIQVWISPSEIDFLMENLRPEGVWLSVGGVKDVEEAEVHIKKLAKWGCR